MNKSHFAFCFVAVACFNTTLLTSPTHWVDSPLQLFDLFSYFYILLCFNPLDLLFLQFSFNFCWGFRLCDYLLGGLFISFCVPFFSSSYLSLFVGFSPPIFLLVFFHVFLPYFYRLPILLVAYVPVNVPPPAPTCPPSFIPALTLCCSQRPPVSQSAQGAPLPPPQRLHGLQTQNAMPPEPEARGKSVCVRAFSFVHVCVCAMYLLCCMSEVLRSPLCYIWLLVADNIVSSVTSVKE